MSWMAVKFRATALVSWISDGALGEQFELPSFFETFLRQWRLYCFWKKLMVTKLFIPKVLVSLKKSIYRRHQRNDHMTHVQSPISVEATKTNSFPVRVDIFRNPLCVLSEISLGWVELKNTNGTTYGGGFLESVCPNAARPSINTRTGYFASPWDLGSRSLARSLTHSPSSLCCRWCNEARLSSSSAWYYHLVSSW